MTIRRVVAVIVVALASLAAVVGAGSAGSSFGEPMNPDLEPTSIASIVGDPDAWVGKQVRVAGEVSGVCTRQGCWMDLASADDATIRVKVDDGVIVFPEDAVGKQAVAEGAVEILDMDKDRYEAWIRHVAEEEGRDYDPAEIGEPPYRIVRIRGIGAEIEGL